MPKNKDLKRLVRTRMQKTGESYSVALRAFTNEGATHTPASAQVTTELYARWLKDPLGTWNGLQGLAETRFEELLDAGFPFEDWWLGPGTGEGPDHDRFTEAIIWGEQIDFEGIFFRRNPKPGCIKRRLNGKSAEEVVNFLHLLVHQGAYGFGLEDISLWDGVECEGEYYHPEYVPEVPALRVDGPINIQGEKVIRLREGLENPARPMFKDRTVEDFPHLQQFEGVLVRDGIYVAETRISHIGALRAGDLDCWKNPNLRTIDGPRVDQVLRVVGSPKLTKLNAEAGGFAFDRPLVGFPYAEVENLGTDHIVVTSLMRDFWRLGPRVYVRLPLWCPRFFLPDHPRFGLVMVEILNDDLNDNCALDATEVRRLFIPGESDTRVLQVIGPTPQSILGACVENAGPQEHLAPCASGTITWEEILEGYPQWLKSPR